ncbi:alpha/beta fold hydrolase [Clostridium bovifaecis]|uniref:Alpha/beta fold hydrolase n=1 Tax=Clostridium bovifaecis TaxID=2184719 RepID=A0A6I6FA13_9CLOT|nr:alpha/beta fold hydrolase [Clostridium bovifaecis]
MSYFLTSDNTKIFYNEAGNGRPVVLIHGWSCSHLHFQNQINELSRNYRVIYYDLRGHGISEVTDYGLTLPRFAQDLKELIEHLNLKDVTLVGWSMGTSIIFDYVKQFGCANLYKLCLIDMAPKIITDETWKYGLYDGFSYEDNLNTMVDLNANWHKFAEGFIPAIFAKSGCRDKNILDWAFEQAFKNSPHVMIRMWVSMSSQNYLPVLSKITVPTLITYGAESFLYSNKNSEYMNREIPNSRLVSFPRCGHALFMEKPEMFNEELIKFIEE